MSWKQFRRDHHNTGTRRDLESPSRPSVAWAVELEGASTESPVLGRDAVYVGTEVGAYAFDRETGGYRWPFRTDAPVLAPVLTDAGLAIVTRNGAVYGLETRTGDQRWQQGVPSPVTSPPAAHDGRVYVGHAEGVTAFAADTGDRVWAHETDAATVGSPAIYDGRVYIGTREDDVLAIKLEPERNASTDSSETEPAETAPTRTAPAETAPTRTASAETEPSDDDTAPSSADAPVKSTDANAESAISDVLGRTASVEVDGKPDETGETEGDADDTGDGSAEEPDGIAWRAPIKGSIAGGPTVVSDGGRGRVYVADDGGLMLAMDAEIGQSWFTYEIRGAFTSAPTVVSEREDDDAVFVAADDAYLHVTDTQFGTRQVRGWLFAKKGISLDGVTLGEPALVGDTICLGDETGSVYGIDVDDLDFAWHVQLDAGVSGGPAVAADGAYVVTDDDRLVRLAWGERDRAD